MDNNGKPRAPRRLFSFDSMKTSSTRRSSSETSYSTYTVDVVEPKKKSSRGNLQTHSKTPTLDQVAEDDHLNANWKIPETSESPRSMTPNNERERRKFSPNNPNPRPPLPPVLTDAAVRSVTPDDLPPASPVSVRWNSIRQHVLPPSSSKSSSSSHVLQSSSASLASVSTATPSRSGGGHGKQGSKFTQRLGFRNVVDQAKEQAKDNARNQGIYMIDEEMQRIQRFAMDVQRACMAARYVDSLPQNNSKFKMDWIEGNFGHGAIGSAMNLPFMSSTSLATGGGSGMNSANASRIDLRQGSRSESRQGSRSDLRQTSRNDLRQTSGAGSISGVVSGRVRPLHQTLLNYAGEQERLPQLPMETLVMSTLLMPFLTTEPAGLMDEDRRLSTEAFQIVLRTWSPTTEIFAAERALWCVQAALSALPPLRTRILQILRSMTVPENTHYPITQPRLYQTLLHGLFLLLPSVRAHVPPGVAPDSDTEDSALISEIISHVCAGSCGDVDDNAVEEEYNALVLEGEGRSGIRDALVVEALAKCLEYGGNGTRRWLLKNSVENLWSLPDELAFTPLLTAIHSRALYSFTRAALKFLSSSNVSSPSPSYFSSPIVTSPSPGDATSPFSSPFLTPPNEDASLIVHVLKSRVLPELQYIANGSSKLSDDAGQARTNVVLLVLNVVPSDSREMSRWGIGVIGRWYKEGKEWKECFEKTLKDLIMDKPWPEVLNILPPLIRMIPQDISKFVVTVVLGALNDRLPTDPPPHPCQPLSSLLTTIAQYPAIFYKPLFACSASSREYAVVNHLGVLASTTRWMPGFWSGDAEMMSVAIMGDVGPPAKGKVKGDAKDDPKGKEKNAVNWGTARLGQSVLLVELIAQVQTMRRVREGPNSSASDNAFAALVKFCVALEQRLSLLIETKERTTLVPPSQRLLFCMLFREIRLLTRSLKNASWLPRFVEWFVSYHENDRLHENTDLELQSAIEQIRGVYALAQSSGHSGKAGNKHRSTMIVSPPSNADTFTKIDPANTSNDSGLSLSAVFAQRNALLEGISRGFEARAMKLMVAMSAMIAPGDFRRLGTILWDRHLEDADAAILSSVCFLVMQCAEKGPNDLLATIEVDLQSSSDETRLSAIRKMSILSNWRFQIMAQHVIADRAHRPFKVARGPLPFVLTDMGSGSFVPELDPNEVQDKLPQELRKKLAEIGWDDDEGPVNQQLEWIRTPMSNLPALQMDSYGHNANTPLSPSPSPSPVSSPSKSPILGEKAEELNLLRRNSTSGGPLSGLKRRAIFVPNLAQVLPRIATMVFDPSFVVAYAARNMVFDLMRNDPGLLTRPVYDLFTGEDHDLPSAVTSLRAFLHSRRVLPPAMAHAMFNTLAGYLKFLAKQMELGEEILHAFAHIVPTMAKLVTQVYEMSIRELRRAKVEMFLIPSGSLWFPESAPPGPMFPRGPGHVDNPFEDITQRIVSVTIIRISQNMLFLAMLKRNSAEVQAVRKNMAKLVFPSLDGKNEFTALELRDFVPQKRMASTKTSVSEEKIQGLSVMLSRSYVLLVAQIFRSLSRHLNDRNELAVLIDALNRILLAHGNDVGVVAQTLIALMVAATRFRRLFASGGGYTLFMPVLFKVYAESEDHPGIRYAIEYAVNRFYAFHEETFVFQSLDAIAHILVLPGIGMEWIVKNIYTLFASLRRSLSPNDPDAAGIHHANKSVEREALMVMTAEEKPQTFFASLRPGGGPHGPQQQNGRSQFTLDLPAEYESKRFAIDDFVRLFLTVIAHDLSIARAEQFLKLLRYLAPSLYDASNSARSVLQEGLEALGAILSRPLPKNKPAEYSRQDDGQSEKSSINGMQLGDMSKAPSDLSAMRMDYLWLLVSFTQAGGRLIPETSRAAFDLARAVLRDSPTLQSSVASCLGAFAKSSLMPHGGRSLKAVVYFLRDLAPIVNAYALTIDFSEVFDTIGDLSRNPMYANDPTFCGLVVNQICAAGLRACQSAAAEKLLQSLPSRRSLIKLMTDAVLLPGADIFSELEAHKPEYSFLALVVLPLALTMKTLADIDSEKVQLDYAQRDMQARAWSRLLLYAISSCQKSHVPGETSSPILERSRSQDRRSSTMGHGSHLQSLLLALQVIKVILIRADRDLNKFLPDIWSRLAVFLREVLGEGGAEFCLRSNSLDYSPLASPIPSPRASGQFDLSFGQHMSSSLSGGRSFVSPRILDYCLWSFLELLCVHRNPLFIQLRAFTHEKVRVLDQQIRYQQNAHTPSGSRSRRPSSVFTKPRRRMSNVLGGSSPDASPRMTNLASPDVSLSGYHSIHLPPPLSHSSSQDSSTFQGSGPRIVHLGLVSSPNAPFRRSLSPAGTSAIRHLAKSTKVKSVVLIRKTYLRIRVVQSCMGYESMLLPLPQTSIDSASQVEIAPDTTAWSKRRALQEVTSETRELLEEFEESFNELDSEGVLVDDSRLSVDPS